MGIAPPPPAIVARNVSMRFPVRRPWAELALRPFRLRWTTALEGIDLEVGAGEVVGLLGPNGAGKTTLLKILCTLLLPSGGRAAVNGVDVSVAPRKVRQAVGSCLDTERSFYFRLTGNQNLEFFAALNNLDSREAAARIARALRTVRLDGAGDALFMTYSKGMQQKLGLARALLTDPSVLLLDEPTKSLDPGAAAELRHFLRATLADRLGRTILLATHSLEEARECCDRVVIMDRGRIALQGSWAEAQAFITTHGFPVSAAPGRS
jgi:ABC-2 type transport system ATP-binding protein